MTGHVSHFSIGLFAVAILAAACGKTEPVPEPDPTPVVPVVTMPRSLTVTTDVPLSMGWGKELPLEFELSPVSALEGLSLEDLTRMITLEGASGQELSGYVLENLQQDGARFSAVVRDTRSKGFYSDRVVLVYTREDSRGRRHEVRSDSFGILSTAFTGPSTGLPLVFVDTPDAQPIVSKDDWIPETTVRIFLADGTLDFEGTSSVKGRGNSTWTQFPKKPYALKLDSKAEMKEILFMMR